MPPRRLLLAALVLAALAVLLYVVLRGGDDKPAADAGTRGNGSLAAGDPSSTSPGDRPRVPPGTRVVVPAPGGGAVGSDGQPLVAQPDPSIERTPSPPSRNTISDTGNEIRDHRSDTTREAVALPAPVAPAQRTLSSAITADIYSKLAPIVRGCGATLPADALGDSPIVHVTLTVHVTAGTLVTDDATAVTNHIKAPASEQVIGCVRDRASGLTAAAKGEADRTDYVVQFPIRLRK